MNEWHRCRKVLVIRPDNMGDLLMSSPALRALKQTFNCHLTVLTSTVATGIAGYINEIDEVISYDLPWIKTDAVSLPDSFLGLLQQLKHCEFDGAVIFTVYSQNPMPSILLAYLAGIPLRLAYCRENPYQLLTHWIPDKEPYSFIQHQVRRDLSLVASVGALATEENLSIRINKKLKEKVLSELTAKGVHINKPWIILHAGVSEEKRRYPNELWIKAGKEIIRETGHQLVLTGSPAERHLTELLKDGIGADAFSLGGFFSLEEFLLLIRLSPLVLSVNTGTVHIAAAVGTPVVVLYALTNPQHLPWKVKGQALYYAVPEETRSKNEVVAFVSHQLDNEMLPMVSPDAIVKAVQATLSPLNDSLMPEMVPFLHPAD